MSLTTCPECAKPVSSEAIACPACGHPIKPSPTPAKKTGLWWGLGGLLGGLLAVPAILMVVAIIGLLSGLLSSIAIPSFMRARTTSQANACINNLRQIEAAKHAYALEQGLTNGATVTFENIGPTAPGGGYLKAWPGCPSSAHAARTRSSAENDYDINVIGQNPRCRIVPDKHAFAESHDDSSLNPSIVVSDSSSNPNITVSNCTAKVALGGNRAKKTNGFSCVSSILNRQGFANRWDIANKINGFFNGLGFVISLAWVTGFGLVVVLLTLIFPVNVKRIACAMKREFLKSAAIGLAIKLALIPALVIMTISCIGIPLIPFVSLFYIVACLLGLAGLCAVIGSRCLAAFGRPQPAAIGAMAIGFACLSVLVILGGLIRMAGYPFSIFGTILIFTYCIVLICGTIVGLGAVCITRFGSRDVEVAFPLVPVIPPENGCSGMNGLIYCRTCGEQVAAKAITCPGCGAKPFDGKAYCYNCGNSTEPNAIVCVKCGIAAHYAVNQQKSFVAALIFSILLGSLGVDRFYLGYVLLGLLKLFTFGGFGIWWLIDVVLIATNSLKDANGVPMKM